MKFLLAAFASLSARTALAFSPAAPTVAGRRASSTSLFSSAAPPAALSQEELKKLVGYKSVDDYVSSGMVVGLGTGSTAYYAVERLGQKLASGELEDIVAIPTSVRTKEQAEELGIPLVTLDTHSRLDVAIDGADEVDPDLNLVKGGGGALLREKMVEVCAEKFVVIVDESKLCEGLGPGFPLPVEITPFCHEHTLRTIAGLPSVAGADAVLRMGSSSSNVPDGDEIAVTDNGNYIVDLHFKEPIADAPTMAKELKNTVGVVDHGLFCDMTSAVIIAGSDGISVKEAEAKPAALSQDELKKMVGYKSVDDYVESGMVVGLGTGSTAYYAVERLGQKLASGELTDIVAIPTSVRTKEQAEELGIPLVTLDTHSKLDVAIDGADDVDPDLNLVKGGGGALLREKMVEVCADKFIVIVDESKIGDGLGPGFPLPVEITPFCHEHTLKLVAALPSCAGAEAVLRMGSSSSNVPDGDEIAVTDNGNYIVDLHFTEPIADAPKMAEELKNTVGVVDHGLFCGMASAVIIAGSDGVSVKEA